MHDWLDFVRKRIHLEGSFVNRHLGAGRGTIKARWGLFPSLIKALHGKAAVILGSWWSGNVVTYCIAQSDKTKCETKRSPTSWWNLALPCHHTH